MVTPARTPLRADRLRALNVPEPVRVEVDAAGRPAAIGRGASIAQAVEAVLEVWRVDDEWWRQPISRLYHDVVLESGGHLVLFEDLVTGDWFAQQS